MSYTNVFPGIVLFMHLYNENEPVSDSSSTVLVFTEELM